MDVNLSGGERRFKTPWARMVIMANFYYNYLSSFLIHSTYFLNWSRKLKINIIDTVTLNNLGMQLKRLLSVNAYFILTH
jgi:hypothetical protein